MSEKTEKSCGILPFSDRFRGRSETRIQRAADVVFLFRAEDENRVVGDPHVAGDCRFFSQHRYRERKALLPIDKLDDTVCRMASPR